MKKESACAGKIGEMTSQMLDTWKKVEDDAERKLALVRILESHGVDTDDAHGVSNAIGKMSECVGEMRLYSDRFADASKP